MSPSLFHRARALLATSALALVFVGTSLASPVFAQASVNLPEGATTWAESQGVPPEDARKGINAAFAVVQDLVRRTPDPRMNASLSPTITLQDAGTSRARYVMDVVSADGQQVIKIQFDMTFGYMGIADMQGLRANPRTAQLATMLEMRFRQNMDVVARAFREIAFQPRANALNAAPRTAEIIPTEQTYQYAGPGAGSFQSARPRDDRGDGNGNNTGGNNNGDDDDDDTITPPDGGDTTPPDGGDTTPPDGGDTTPPDGGDTTPPDGGDTTPPDGGDTTPPDGGDTTPPGGGGELPDPNDLPGGGGFPGGPGAPEGPGLP